MEINPQQNVVLKPLAQHIIRIELQWTPTNIPGAIINYDETGNYPCRNTGGSGSQTGGNLSYEIIDVVGGQYEIQFRFNIPCQTPRIVVEAQYSIYYDGTFIRTGSFSLANCYNGITFPFHNTSYRTPLITDYSFGFYSQDLCFGSYEPIELPLGLGCTNTEIDTSTEMVNLQILANGEYASFYGYEGIVTDNLTLPHSMLNRVELRQDEFYSGSEMNVIVQSNLGGIIKQDQIKIHPRSSYGLEVSYVNYPIEYNETKYIEISPVGPGGCRAEFPPDILLNAEIIKGSELGQLQDSDTGQMGDSLNNIPIQTFGGNHIAFVADGSRNATNDTVIVKYFTTEPEMESVEVPIIIWPGSIYIALEPDSISAGQTANVIIKRRNIDGTLENFDSTQTFEIGIFDGCNLGYLIAGADTSNYFNEVMMPIKYLAADNFENGGIVKIKGGPIEEIIIGKAGKNEIILSKNILLPEKYFRKKEKNKTENKDATLEQEEVITDDPVSSSCFSGNFNIYSIGERSFFVGDGCSGLLNCVGKLHPEFVQYNIIQNGILFNNPNICSPNIIDPNTGLMKIQVGGFSALDWRPNRSQSIGAETCYNNTDKKVQFKMKLMDIATNQNSLILKPEAIFEICDNNIRNAGLILIHDTVQVINILRQYPEQAAIIKADMDNTLATYDATVQKYKFISEIIAHETEHKKDYEYYLESFKTESLDRKVLDYSFTCSQFKADPYATELAKVKYLQLVIDYIQKSNNIASKQTNEMTLHQRIGVQTSLAVYYILLYKFENGIKF